MIGIANAVGASLPVLYAGKIGRRPVFVVGHFAIALGLFLCGLCVLYEWNLEAFIFIIVYILCF